MSAPSDPKRTTTRRTALGNVVAFTVLGSVTVLAFTYPFWMDLAGASITTSTRSHALPLIASAIGLCIVTAVAYQLERRSLRPATLSLLAALGTIGGFARVFDLPAGGNLIFVVIVLGAVAYGPEFGFLLGLSSMGIGALLTGGLGPWLPFQMLAAAALGATCGLGTHCIRSDRFRSRIALAATGAVAALVFGLVINLWSWPFLRQEGDLTWVPGGALSTNLSHYWRYYVTTSLAWDIAGAALNAVVLFLIGRTALRILIPARGWLNPHVVWNDVPPATQSPNEPRQPSLGSLRSLHQSHQ